MTNLVEETARKLCGDLWDAMHDDWRGAARNTAKMALTAARLQVLELVIEAMPIFVEMPENDYEAGYQAGIVKWAENIADALAETKEK